MADEKSFLQRWSRRKAEVREGRKVPDIAPAPTKPGRMIFDTPGETAAATETGTEPPVAVSPEAPADAGPAVSEAAASAPERPPAPTMADVETLDAETDIRRFLAADVAPEVRQGALFKLWSTDPVLAGVDDLNDLSHDWTDAAVAVPDGMLKTAYKVGQGFLSDAEVAVWQALGRPKVEPEAEAGEEKQGEGTDAAVATAAATGDPPSDAAETTATPQVAATDVPSAQPAPAASKPEPVGAATKSARSSRDEAAG